MRWILLVYFISGFVSLGYQVAWFRIFVERFGSSNLTFAAVVASFIGGLGLGALLSRRITTALAARTRVASPLRLYGLIEIAIATSALLTIVCGLIPDSVWGGFPYRLVDGIYRPAAHYQLTRLLLTTLCVFIPCLLMGTTFPLLCWAFRGDPRMPSKLYAWNALGAVVAVIGCEFLLLPAMGYSGAFLALLGLNLAIGFAVLAPGRSWLPSVREAHAREASARRGSANDTQAPPSASSGHGTMRGTGHLSTSAALACGVVSGLLTGGLEGDAFKRLWFIGCNKGPAMSFISFWAVLGIFLGSLTVRLWRGMALRHVKLAVLCAGLLYAMAWRFAYPLIDWTHSSHRSPLAESGASRMMVFDFQDGLFPLWIYTGIFVLAPFYLVSLLLPYVCDRVHARGSHVGTVYGLNTIAFCVSLVGFTWIAPRVNFFYSSKLFFAMFAVLAAFLMLIRESRRLPAWTVLATACLLIASAVLVPHDFDPGFFRPGDPQTLYGVSAVKSNAAHTTYVLDHPGGKRLYFDNYTMSSASETARRYMGLMAHFPLLLQVQPKAALLLCFGAGNTGAAIAAHESIEAIDVVDLNDKVYETAPEFASVNRRVYADPRVRLIHDDGRNFLRITERTYDLVTSEPPPPMEDGVYRLYSREYYAAVLRRLSPAGMMTQWIPVNQMPREAVEMAVTTFVASFPQALLFVGDRHQFILLGSKVAVDAAVLEARFDDSRQALEDLRRAGIRRVSDLLARVVKGDASLRRDFGEGPVLSDQHNAFAHMFLDPGHPAVVTYNPAEVIEEIGVETLDCAGEVRRALSHMGFLRASVPDFPADTLMTVRHGGTAGVKYAEVDWHALERLEQRADRYRAQGRWEEGAALLRESLSVAPEQPHILFFLLYAENAAGMYESAVATARYLQDLAPGDWRGPHHMGLALFNLGRFREATEQLRRARRLDPRNPSVHILLGDTLAAVARFHEAADCYERALALDGTNEKARGRHERVLEAIAATSRREGGE